ncbi:hypothetical protein RUND412_000693 [Rhizina undulata]
MSTPMRPLISIKAGKCTQNGSTVIPNAEPGILYLYTNEDGLICFNWNHRSSIEPEDELILFPGDTTFLPYTACKSGRVFVLKFSSSSQRHFYWLQSKSESPEGNPGFWSARDKKWGERINQILQQSEDEDEEMGDVLGSDDVEDEGSASRRGGEDGGRATANTETPSDLIQRLIQGIQLPGRFQPQSQQQPSILALHDLLPPSTTTPLIADMSPATLDKLISNLPPAIIPKDATEAQKKEIVIKVLHSPQFTQSLVSLTVALREGGLRGVADSLGVGLARGEEGVGKDQVELFVDAVREDVEKEGRAEGGNMDID